MTIYVSGFDADSAVAHDAGTQPGEDAWTPPGQDSGAQPVDAWTPPGQDAWTPPEQDAATPQADAWTPQPDAWTPQPDAATPVQDAGYVNAARCGVRDVDIPMTGAAGSVQRANITVFNTGTSTWTEAADHSSGFRLRSLSGNTMTWLAGTSSLFSHSAIDQGVYLSASVPPGGQTTFRFQLQVPNSSGTHVFSAQMMAPGDVPFGNVIPATITVGPAPSTCTGAHGAGDDGLDPALVTTWVDANLGDSNTFPVNARLDTVTVYSDQRTIRWTGVRLAGGERWYAEKNFHACPTSTDPTCVDGNMTVIGCINGAFAAATFEYVYAGVASATSHLEWNAGDPIFIQASGNPVSSWSPAHGDQVYFVMHSLTRGRNVRPAPRGRSQIFGPVTWP